MAGRHLLLRIKTKEECPPNCNETLMFSFCVFEDLLLHRLHRVDRRHVLARPCLCRTAPISAPRHLLPSRRRRHNKETPKAPEAIDQDTAVHETCMPAAVWHNTESTVITQSLQTYASALVGLAECLPVSSVFEWHTFLHMRVHTCLCALAAWDTPDYLLPEDC